MGLTEESTLAWGYRAGVPAGVTTAWGCRAIVDADGQVDVPPDRQSGFGPQISALLDHLNTHVVGAWRDHASELLSNEIMRLHARTEFVLYQDNTVIIKGNTVASGGYLYVCAYFCEEVKTR